MTHSSFLPPFLLSLLLLSLFQSPADAAKQSYIVYLGRHSHGLNPTSLELQAATNSHYDLLGSVLGSNERAQEAMFYSYTGQINGFAAVLDEEEASQIAKNPNVVSVLPNRKEELHTTHSWEFMELEDKAGVPRPGSLWKKAKFGEDIIIGNLDTGVWPESDSFNDEGFGPIPSKWRGACLFDTKDKVRCNRKLIGARYFNKGYLANVKLNKDTIPPSLLVSPRDQEGHGSHTLSTAGGSFVPGANAFGNGNGTAKGGSPKARVAAYKVCWPSFDGYTEGGCFSADIFAAFDAAISDGADVLSLSLGGNAVEFSQDEISIGAFHADKHGIVVVCSAGNSGPTPGTVTNVAPWMLTVGASTLDREFTSFLTFGRGKHLKGRSLSSTGLPSKKYFPLISGANANAAIARPEDSLLCLNGTLNPKKVKGKILVCLRGGDISRTEKGVMAALAGAVGMVLVNDEESGNDITADPHVLPATHLTYTDGKRVFEYLNSTKTAMARITRVKTVHGTKPAPVMAAFSSRGPSPIEPSILKPDITAPGVDIIAAFTGATGPTDPSNKRRPRYITESGTSMSCPHVSGIVGLLKTLYPTWSPAAIRSAIITTARRRDNVGESILDSTKEPATPFAYGAGHVNPNHAADPGLVYDLTTNDYLNFLCARGYNASVLKLFSDKPVKCSRTSHVSDLNYPTIAVPDLQDKPITISRRVKNVGTPGTYVAQVQAPAGVSVSVQPSKLEFKSVGEEKEFKVTLKANSKVRNQDHVFGELKWSDGKHNVRSPIAVMQY